MAKLIMTVEEMQDREAWLKSRTMGIGGSDAGIVAGLSRWKSPYQLWMEKTGQVIPEDISDNEYVIWGNKLEQLVADRFCELTGKRVKKRGLLKSDRKPFMLASVDRMVVGEPAGLECKTANGFAAKEWEGDNIPDAYYAQCQHYMSVTGLDKWYIACLIGGNHFVWKEVPRSDSDIEALEACEEEFWKHVQDVTPPPIDGSDSCTQALKEKFRGGIEEALTLDAEAEKLVATYQSLKEAKSGIEAQIDLIKNQLCDILGDHETAFAGETKVSWKTQAGRTTLDSKALKKDMPEVFEKYAKTGNPIRVFKIT